MASIFLTGWFFAALFVFVCIMVALIHDKRKRDAEDRMRTIIKETYIEEGIHIKEGNGKKINYRNSRY